MNTQYQNAIQNKNLNAPPIWFMRQAGRYHKHYQNLRSKHSFMDLCKVPELAAEVAMGPIQDFDFDVAILFSDLLFPLEALGMGLDYTEQGPRLGWHLNPDNTKNLSSIDEAIPKLQFQSEAVRLTRQRLSSNKSLVGFVGGPWTLFVYACEGSHAGNLLNSKSQLSLYTTYLETMLPLLEQNIDLQLKAGAEVVYIFDTAVGELSPLIFADLIQPGLTKLAAKFPGKLYYYSKGTYWNFFSDDFKNLNWAGLGFDHRNAMAELLSNQNFNCGLQGNFDQALLHCDTQTFKKLFTEYLRPIKDLPKDLRKNWICGLGHGVLPKTPEEHVKFIVDHVRKEFA